MKISNRKKSELILGVLLLFFGCLALFVPNLIEDQFHVNARSFVQTGYHGIYIALFLLSKTIAVLGSLTCFYLSLKKFLWVLWGKERDTDEHE